MRGEARAQRDAIATGSPFIDLVGLGVPWAAGVFAAVGSTLALKAPDEPSTFRDWPLAPAASSRRCRVTNAAQFGYAIDTETGPDEPRASSRRTSAGWRRRATRAAGATASWRRCGARPPRSRASRAPTASPGTTRGGSRSTAAPSAGGVANPAQHVLGVRATRGRAVDVPIYAFETSLGQGPRARRRARPRAPRRRPRAASSRWSTRSATDAHCDPLFDAPPHQRFLRSVVPFLKRL